MIERLWRYAARQAGPRDGQARAFEGAEALDAIAAGLASGSSGTARAGAPDVSIAPVAAPARATGEHGAAFDDPSAVRLAILHRSLSAKVLGAFLANRFQTATPLTLNFAIMDDREARLLMEIAAATLAASGRNSAAEIEALGARLTTLRAGERERDALDAAFQHPRALSDIVAETLSAAIAGHSFATAAVAARYKDEATNHFLAYLAARYGMAGEDARGIVRRFRN